jgi:hypothetical protein
MFLGAPQGAGLRGGVAPGSDRPLAGDRAGCWFEPVGFHQKRWIHDSQAGELTRPGND